MSGIRVSGRRDGVITTAPPWMTAENPANANPRAAEGAVKFDGLQEIIRAGGGKPTAGRRPGGEFEHRIEDSLVKTDRQADDGAEDSRDHGFSSGRASKPRRRACRSQSASSSAKVAWAAPARAMVTRKRRISANPGAWAWTSARNRRRRRLRSWALPLRLVVMKPVRSVTSEGSSKVLKMTNRPAFA